MGFVQDTLAVANTVIPNLSPASQILKVVRYSSKVISSSNPITVVDKTILTEHFMGEIYDKC